MWGSVMWGMVNELAEPLVTLMLFVLILDWLRSILFYQK